MAVSLTHSTVAVGTDAGNGEVRKAAWNANHTLTAAAGKVLGTQTGATTVSELPIAVDGSGNVGIGSTSPTTKLHVRSDANALTFHGQLQNRNAGASVGSALLFINAANDFADNRYAYIGAITTGAGENGNHLVFAPNANGAAAVEKMRLDSVGKLTLGGKYVPYVFAQSGTAASVGAVTTETTLATISFSGSELGPNGWLQVIMQWTMTNNANVKDARVRLGGAAGTVYTAPTLTSIAGLTRLVTIANSNSQSAQKTATPAGNAVGVGSFSSTGVTSTVNTASSWDLVITGQKANSADTLTLEGYQVIVCYGA